MRVSGLRLCAVIFTIGAISACSGGDRGMLPSPAVPETGISREALTTCASAKDQPAWIFKGACQTGAIGGKGMTISLPAYKGFAVSGSIAKTSLRKPATFVAVDATGIRDIAKFGGKAFPKYVASGSKTLLYLQFVNGGASPIRIKGKPAIQLAITDAKATPGSDCSLALLQGTGSKLTWNALALPVKVKGGTYSIAIPSLPVALNPGAAYIVLACSTTVPSPSPTPSVSPSPTPAGSITVYNPLPYGYTSTPITGMTDGPDGNVWFALSADYLVGKITPSGSFTTYPVRDTNSGYTYTAKPEQIAAGSDGNLWFTANSPSDVTMCGCIYSITPNGVQTLYRVPQSASCGDVSTEAITSGPDGNIWFSEAGSSTVSAGCSNIGRLDLTTKTFTMFDAGNVEGVAFGVTSGPDGNVWFTDDKGYIGRMTTSGVLTKFPLSDYAAGSAPSGIVAGSDENLWFTVAPLDPSSASAPSGIGRITTSGTITEFADPSARWCGSFGLNSIAKDGDGNLWFGCESSLASSTTSGSITDYPSSVFSNAGMSIFAMTWGTDGNLWLGGAGGNVARYK
jgi:virginiamycin B lyase